MWHVNGLWINFFFPDRKSYGDYYLGMERKRTGEKILCSHARANVVVCCVLFHKIYTKPLELTGKCLQKIASNTFHYYSVPSSLSPVLGPILICTHTVIYPACPLLPFSGIICSEVTAKSVFGCRYHRPWYYALCCLSTTHVRFYIAVNGIRSLQFRELQISFLLLIAFFREKNCQIFHRQTKRL